MTMKIDFHILEQANQQQALLYVCQQAEKAYAAEQTVYIHVCSAAEAKKLDALLWTFKDESFVAHELFPDSTEAPVLIGYGETAPKADILINLSDKISSFYPQFPQMLEIVFSEPTMQQLARERFRHYRDQQHELNTIKINTGDA